MKNKYKRVTTIIFKIVTEYLTSHIFFQYRHAKKILRQVLLGTNVEKHLFNTWTTWNQKVIEEMVDRVRLRETEW